MLSRLISLLRRIPAVKWAFTRLRPAPLSGSIDVAPVAAGQPPAIVADIAEASPARDTSISADALHRDTAVAERGTARSVMAESLSAAPIEIIDSFRETPAEVEPVVVEEPSVSPVDEGAVDVESAVAEQAPASSVDVGIVPDDAPAPIVSDDPSSRVVLDVEPTLNDSYGAIADDEVPAEHVPEDRIETDPSPAAAAAIEPALAYDPAPVAALAAEDPPAEAPSVVTDIEPAPALVASSPETRIATKVRTRAVEPADRTALIRQRWAETGIRMWNPRLYGAGKATLNIQGSAGLLPPSPGETMPRYDKLEFRMLGGQIICEGVIVEAPTQAGHRSFTRLAEPAKPERVREPIRERQAALA